MRLLLNDNITAKRANCTCYSWIISWLFGLTAPRHAGQRYSITPYITPRLTPSGTPKIISTSASPKGYSAAGSPQKTSGATSPTKPQYDGRASLSSWYPSSQQSSAANSPPRGHPIPGLYLLWFQIFIYQYQTICNTSVCLLLLFVSLVSSYSLPSRYLFWCSFCCVICWLMSMESYNPITI